jgi:hypothetical protein
VFLKLSFQIYFCLSYLLAVLALEFLQWWVGSEGENFIIVYCDFLVCGYNMMVILSHCSVIVNL